MPRRCASGRIESAWAIATAVPSRTAFADASPRACNAGGEEEIEVNNERRGKNEEQDPMISLDRRHDDGESPTEAQWDADHPLPRKNDEVPENRQAPDTSHSEDDDERPHGDRRGS